MTIALRNIGLQLALSGLALGVAVAAGGSSTPPPSKPKAEPTAEQAVQHYNAGLGKRDQAWKLEEKLEGAPSSTQGSLESKIRDAYDSAVGEFRRAVELDPSLHQAWGSLGYALRRLGDYDGALEAYDRSLTLKPDYGEALEYRAEAYLALNRIPDAQQAYGELESRHPDLANELLGAMRSWVEARRVEPGGVKVGQLDQLERWIDGHERGEVPASSSLRKSRRW